MIQTRFAARFRPDFIPAPDARAIGDALRGAAAADLPPGRLAEAREAALARYRDEPTQAAAVLLLLAETGRAEQLWPQVAMSTPGLLADLSVLSQALALLPDDARACETSLTAIAILSRGLHATRPPRQLRDRVEHALEAPAEGASPTEEFFHQSARLVLSRATPDCELAGIRRRSGSVSSTDSTGTFAPPSPPPCMPACSTRR